MVLENEIYIISKTSIKTAKTNNNFIQDEDYTRITKKEEFRNKANELLNFIKNNNNTLDNTIEKHNHVNLYGYDYVFVIKKEKKEKNKYNILKIIDNVYENKYNYFGTQSENNVNDFENFLQEAIKNQNLEKNFKEKREDEIKDKIDTNDGNYRKINDHIKKTKTDLEKIDNTYTELINHLKKNNKDILNDFNKLKTDISKDIEEAIKKINNIKKKEDTNFLEKITNEVNEELGLE